MVRIPSEYQEVEYLESTGTQYIDTGIAAETYLNVSIDFAPTVSSYIFGVTNYPNGDYFGLNCRFNYTFEGYYASSNYPSFGSWEEGKRASLTIIDLNWYINDTLMHTFKPHIYTSQKTLWLFGLNHIFSGNRLGKSKIFGCKLWVGNTALANFIPCYRKSDSEPGMYDTVSKTFFTNQGTGTFLAGSDINYSTVNLLESRRRILLNTPHIEAKSSLSPLSFSTDVVTDLKECKVHFSPVQEGSGTPSPENVREIKGWDGIEVTRCGDFIADIEWEQGAIDADINNLRYTYKGRKVNNATRIRCVSLVSLDSTKTYKIVWNTDTYEIVTQPYGANGLSFKPESPHNIWQTEPYEIDSLHNVAIAIRRKDQANITPSEAVNADVKLLTNSDKISLSFPQTIYGGYVDLIKGEIVEEWKSLNLENLTWKGPYGSLDSGNYRIGSQNIPDLIYASKINELPTFMAEQYQQTLAASLNYTNTYTMAIPNSLYILKGFDGTTWPSGKFVYKSSTPTTYPLTPQSLKSLRGLNNILTNANGNIDIKFYSH